MGDQKFCNLKTFHQPACTLQPRCPIFLLKTCFCGETTLHGKRTNLNFQSKFVINKVFLKSFFIGQLLEYLMFLKYEEPASFSTSLVRSSDSGSDAFTTVMPHVIGKYV